MDLSPSPATLWTQPYAVTSLITCVLTALLGAFTLWKNQKSLAARWWAIMCFCVSGWAFWTVLSFLKVTISDELKFVRLADGVALFIPITFLHFTMHFSGLYNPRILKLGYIITSLVTLTVGTPWFIPEVKWKFGMWYQMGGPTYVVFALLFLLLPAYGTYLLIKAYRKSRTIRKAQLFCLIAACTLGFGGGFMWFPPSFGIDIPPIGSHIVALYCVIVGFAMVRYQLFDIRVVIRRSLVYSALVTVLTVGYFGLVYGIERSFQITLGYHSIWTSLAAFALMAFLFQPLKVGIQHLVDWVIFRVPQEELARRMERLEEQALQTEKLRAVSTLAAGMAHEIKGPLTALMTYAEFIPERQKDPAFLKKLHEILTSETQRIHKLVQDVLGFAKPKPPQLQPVDLGTLVSSTVDLLSAELLKHHVRWVVDCQHNLSADANQLRQVLINLIQNATDAMPKGGTLTISTQANDGHVELVVSDTGEGIPKELLPRIFEPFVTTKPAGNGLGLAMVHSIIKEHHGFIHVASTPAHGTTFTIKLPL